MAIAPQPWQTPTAPAPTVNLRTRAARRKARNQRQIAMLNKDVGGMVSGPGFGSYGDVTYGARAYPERTMQALGYAALGMRPRRIRRLTGVRPGPFMPVARNLNAAAMGQIPDAVMQAFNTDLTRRMAEITEQFGAGGARFGTDLANTLGSTAGQANVLLRADAQRRSLEAMQQLFGLLGTSTGFEFQRGESALERALRKYGIDVQADTILTQLLGHTIGG